MNLELRTQLIEIAKQKIPNTDVSHDLEHALRVLLNAEMIASKEGWDLDIIVPSALFHDVVVYSKNHPDRFKSQEHSANITKQILENINTYPQGKIKHVEKCILECSFSKWIIPDSLEWKILQDADWLEATWAISIMRTYSSTWQMERPFYHAEDPFCNNREPDANNNALDLFFVRLLKVTDRMHTKTAKEISKRRTDFLNIFLQELALELEGK